MRIARLAVVLIALMAFGLSAHATQYFNWGWETNRPVWGVLGTAPYDATYRSNTTRDCTVSHSGSCSMKLQVPNGSTGDPLNNSMGVDLVETPPLYGWAIVNSRAMYYRWWMRIDSGFSWGTTPGKTKSSRVLSIKDDGTNGRRYTGYLHFGGFGINECDPNCKTNTGATISDSTIMVSFDFESADDSQWHEYIVMVKPNTSASCTAGTNCDAQFQAWRDGVSLGTNNNWKLTDQSGAGMQDAWGGWMVSPYFQLGTGSGGGTIYIDDVSTDDVFNSTFSGGSAPVAGFACSPLSLQAPGATTCTDSSTNTPTSWAWSGGCGTSSSQNPALSCTTGGLKQICLTATNASGSSSPFCRDSYIRARYKKPTGLRRN